MRTRNSDKSAATKKTLPARKTPVRAAQKTPESTGDVETPKAVETRRGSAAKAKQVKATGSDNRLEHSAVEEAKALSDAVEETTEAGVVSPTKSAAKKTGAKTRTPPSRRVVTRRAAKSAEAARAAEAAKSAEAAKVTADESPIIEESMDSKVGEHATEETVTGKTGELSKKENSASDTKEADDHTAVGDCIKNGHYMNESVEESLEQQNANLSGEVGRTGQATLGSQELPEGQSFNEMAGKLSKEQTSGENVDESEKEGAEMEVEVAPIVNFEDSLKQEKSLKEDIILAESKQVGIIGDGEQSNKNEPEWTENVANNAEELREQLQGEDIVDNKEDPKDESFSVHESIKSKMQRDAYDHGIGGDERMERHVDQVNFEEHRGQEPAKVGPEGKHGGEEPNKEEEPEIEPNKEEPEEENGKEDPMEYGPAEEHAEKEPPGNDPVEEHAEKEPAWNDVGEPVVETETLEEEHRELMAAAKERQIKKECEIFVGGLDHDASDEDVKKVFEGIGEVVEVRILKNPSTNKNKGYAFVRFSNKDYAKRALEEIKNPIICGRRCGTAPSEDNDTLFLGNICNTWTKEAIRQKLKDYGVEGVENITLVPDVQREGLSRGFAFIQFSCHSEAMLAYKRLQKPDVVLGHSERTAKVAFAEPLREPDPEIMAQVKSVFIDGLPPQWDEDQLKEKLKVHGEILRIVLARNMPTAKRKDFGFVDFSTHDAAVACIDAINNTGLGDDNSKTKLKARLSNPMPKTQAIKGGMCGGFRIGRGSVGTLTKFERGRARGVHSVNRAHSQFGRGFYQGGRGHFGRMGVPHRLHPNEYGFDYPYVDFPGRQILGRGGRRGSYRGNHHMSGGVPTVPNSSRSSLDRPWSGVPARGRGGHFPPWRQPYSPEAHFGRPPVGRSYNDPYLYGDTDRGTKRPLFMADHDTQYMEPTRLRPRLDYSDHAAPLYANRYSDSFEASGSLYSHNYYGPDYGRGPFPPYPGGDRPYTGGSGRARGYYP